jgi:chalcone isomerase-like protein
LRRPRGRAALAVSLLACLAAPAWGRQLAGVTLPEQTTVGKSTFVLNGMGLREATWLKIDAYFAGLYLVTRSCDADAILRGEQPKRIVLVFLRSISRKRMLKEWDDNLKANIGKDTAALEGRVATLQAWMPDGVGKGDEVALTYLPDRGLLVEIKGKARGTIPGADFARALFAIWLGAQPPNQSLKVGLLGHG